MTDSGEPGGGLAWPDHDSGPTPPPEYKSRERDEDRLTRKPMNLWDRIKFVVLLVAIFFLFVWAAASDNPLLPFRDAFDQTLRAKWWILSLAGLEVLRQVHYLVSEHSPTWHQFWSKRVFGRIEARSGRLDDWTRYRAARLTKLLVFLLIVDLILARALHASPAPALIKLPAEIFKALPFVFQLLFGVFFVIIEFGALFWFLSRGGTDVYYPDDIKTRFSDVWG